MRDALFAAFEDNVITAEEYQHLRELYDGFYEAAARAEAEAKSKAEEVDRRMALAKVSGMSREQYTEFQNTAVTERDELLAGNDTLRAKEYYNLEVDYDKAIANAETEEERTDLKRRKDADLAAIQDKQEIERAGEEASQDEFLLDSFETLMLGSELSDAYRDALLYARQYYSGVSGTELHDIWKDAYGGNMLAGDLFDPLHESESQQIGKMFAEHLEALGGYNEILKKVEYYESKGQHDTAQRLLDLYAASNIVNGFNETYVEKDLMKLSMPWRRIGNEDYTEIHARQPIKIVYNPETQLPEMDWGEESRYQAFFENTQKYIKDESGGTPFTIPVELPDGAELAKGVTDSAQAELDANPGSWKIYGSYKSTTGGQIMKTYAQRFLAIIKALVGCSIYVWGGNGEDLAKMTYAQRMAYYQKHETEGSTETIAQNIARDEALFQKMAAKGYTVIRAFDCSGLVYYALKQLFPGQKDKAARTFYAECNPSTDKTGMKISDLRAGDFVFKHNGKKITHIGVFLGEKMQIIDATGRDLGVTERSLTSDFNRFGRWPALQAEDPTPEPEPAPIPEPEPVPVTTYVRVVGGSVRIRSGPSTNYRTIKIAHRGERYLLLDYAGSGWYPIKVSDTENGYVTNKVQYTHLYDVEG